MNRRNSFSSCRQEGATLILALVLLLVITLVGTANMRSSSQQISMASYDQNRQQAFKLAESALNKIESEFAHDIDNVLNNCNTTDNQCFTSNCDNGLCFNGQYDTTNPLVDQPHECTLQAPEIPHWNDGTFDTDSTHDTTTIAGYPGFDDPKYIIEFLCYVDADKDDLTPKLCADGSSQYCIPIYRFTVLATSSDDKARVMLQSVARRNN